MTNMAKAKKEIRGTVEFNGQFYTRGQEDALEEALESYPTEAGLSDEEKKRRKTMIEHTHANMAKHGAYGEVGEDGEIVTVYNPDSTLRAGALGRENDPLGERKEAKGTPKDQQERIVRSEPTDLTGPAREGAEQDERKNSTVASEGAGAGSNIPASGKKK